jgi:hypothetical protein
MTAPRKAPAKRPRGAPPIPVRTPVPRQQGAWGQRHHSVSAKRFDPKGNRIARAPIHQRARGWLSQLSATATKAKRLGRRMGRPTTAPRTSLPPTRRRRRPPQRRGLILAAFSVAVAAVALTAVTLEVTSLAIAGEMAFVAEGMAIGAHWYVNRKYPPQPAAQPRSKGKGGYVRGGLCNQPTLDKTLCQNPVAAGQSACHHHGGGGAGTTASKGKSATKRKPAGKQKRPWPGKSAATP